MILNLSLHLSLTLLCISQINIIHYFNSVTLLPYNVYCNFVSLHVYGRTLFQLFFIPARINLDNNFFH